MFYSLFHPRRRFTQFLSLWCMAWMVVPLQFPVIALANPDGGTPAGGSTSITSGPGQVTVNQTSNRAVVNWNGFSINKGETTTFVQPSAKSAILNRVTGGSVSRLDGNLNANGQVYLVNKNGVVVGKTGRVNTGSFTASTHDVANAEFMAGGDLNFSGTSSASVINQGKIKATDGDVTLIARQVENQGRITARKGSVNLAGGTEVLVKPSGTDASGQRVFIKSTSAGGSVVNSGSIRATAAELRAAGGNEYALAVNNSGVIRATAVDKSGGRIVLKAERGIGSSAVASGNVQNSGKLIARASSKATGKRGGSVVVTGENVRLTSTSVIDVSSNGPGGTGGTVNIGGGFQGKDPAIVNARTITMEAGSLINADATGSGGKGGTAILWSDEQTHFLGTITARGEGDAVAGNGGFVEVSSKGYLDFQGLVDTAGGTLLLDPDTLVIGDMPNSNTFTAGDPLAYSASTPNSNSRINLASLKFVLDSNNVLLQVTNTISVDIAIAYNTTSHYLTLQTTDANGSITINAPFSLTGAGQDLTLLTANLILNAPITVGTVASPGTLSGTATIVTVGAGGKIQNAVDAVGAGGVINVAEGTFFENVRIAKELTINGATTGTGTIVDANNAGGSVFYINGNVTLNRLTVTRGTGDGAGIFIDGGTVNILNSTITNNNGDAGSYGGGILNYSGTVLVQNSTIAHNSTGQHGGGIMARASVTIDSSTIAYNQAGYFGGGIANNSSVFLKNSIIAFNTVSFGGGPDLGSYGGVAPFFDQGNNIVRIVDNSTFSTGPLSGTTGSPVNPGIGLLGNYGGPTQTIPLMWNSVAINAGGAGMPATDQRGFVGTGTRNDIGAFEVRSTYTAPDYVVRTNADYNPATTIPIANSLRLTLDLAEAPTTINFDIPVGAQVAGVWTIGAALNAGTFRIRNSTTIDGASQPAYGSTVTGPRIIISANASDINSVFTVNPGAGKDVVLNKLGITGGKGTLQSGQYYGTGLYITSGNLTIQNSEIYGNSLTTSTATITGGGITFGGGGSLTITDSYIHDNNLTATGSTFASAYGGGIFFSGTLLTITGSTISNNHVSSVSGIADGGGLLILGSPATISNSTFYGNSVSRSAGGAGARGGGIIIKNIGSLTLDYSTVANNTGDGIYIFQGTLETHNSIIANNIGSDVLSTGSGTVVATSSYNLIGNTAGSTGFSSDPALGNILNVDPLLAPLGNYGGPTPTMALLPGSPALNKGDTVLPPSATDQRGTGFARVVDGRADIGAFESRGFVYTATSGSGQSAMLTQAFAPLVVTVSALDPGLTNLSGGNVKLTVPGGVGVASATYVPGSLTQTLALVSGTYQTSFALAANLVRGTYSAEVEASPGTTFGLTNTAVSITITPNAGQGKNYGEADTLPYGYVATSIPGVNLTAVLAANPLTGLLTRATSEDAGTYAISLGSLNNLAGANPDYVISLSSTAVDYTILGIPITVTASAGQGKVYGTPDPASLSWTVTSGSLVTGDSLSGMLSRVAGENVGSYLISQGTLSASANYFLTFDAGPSYLITPRSLFIAPISGQGIEFGAPEPALRFLLASGSLVPGDSFTGALSRVAGETPGTYNILPGTLTAGRNYSLSFGTGFFTIASIPLPPPPLTPGAPFPRTESVLPTMDTAAFDATNGRNNEDEDYYLNSMLRTGGNIYYAPVEATTLPGSTYSSSSAKELGK